MKNSFLAALMLALSLLCFAIGFTILYINSASARVPHLDAVLIKDAGVIAGTAIGLALSVSL